MNSKRSCRHRFVHPKLPEQLESITHPAVLALYFALFASGRFPFPPDLSGKEIIAAEAALDVAVAVQVKNPAPNILAAGIYCAGVVGREDLAR